jgi:hypothetical protein
VVFIIDFFPPVGFEISLLDKVALILHQMGFVLKVMFKVSFKVVLEATTMVILEVELKASVMHFLFAFIGSFWDSILISEVVFLKVRVNCK